MFFANVRPFKLIQGIFTVSLSIFTLFFRGRNSGGAYIHAFPCLPLGYLHPRQPSCTYRHTLVFDSQCVRSLGALLPRAAPWKTSQNDRHSHSLATAAKIVTRTTVRRRGGDCEVGSWAM